MKREDDEDEDEWRLNGGKVNDWKSAAKNLRGREPYSNPPYPYLGPGRTVRGERNVNWVRA